MVKPNNQETVGNTPVDVVPYHGKRTSLTIFNVGPVTVFLGGDEGVTPDDGFPIPAGIGFSFLKGLGDDPRLQYWLVTLAANVDIRWWEMILEDEE